MIAHLEFETKGGESPLSWDAGESEELVCFLLFLEQIGRSSHGSKSGGVADGSISVPSKCLTKGEKLNTEYLLLHIQTDHKKQVRAFYDP